METLEHTEPDTEAAVEPVADTPKVTTVPDVQIVSSPSENGRPSAMELAHQREALAKLLRNEHPGEWAVVSQGHVSRGAARMVRDRIKSRECWAGFEWAVRSARDESGTHVIYAKAPGGPEDSTPEPEVHIVPDVDPATPSPTF